MFATPIDTCERLLMEQHSEPIFSRQAVASLHEVDVVIRREICDTKNWRHLVLARSHFVVPYGHRHAYLHHLCLDDFEQLVNTCRHRAKVV
jgi:hypothetical protein